MIEWWRYRPCGACAALVPKDTGCKHWPRPGARKAGKPDRVLVVRDGNA